MSPLEDAMTVATGLIYAGEQLGHTSTPAGCDLPLPEPRRTRELEAGTVRPWVGDWVSTRATRLIVAPARAGGLNASALLGSHP